MKKLLLLPVLLLLLFSCGKSKEDVLVEEEARLWKQLNRLDSVPGDDYALYLTYYAEMYPKDRPYKKMADSVVYLYHKFRSEQIDNNSAVTFHTVKEKHQQRVQAMMSVLNEKDFLKDDYTFLISFKNKLDTLNNHAPRSLQIYSLIELQRLKNTIIAYLYAGCRMLTCGPWPGLHFNKTDSLLTLKVLQFPKAGGSRGSFIELYAEDENVKLIKLQNAGWNSEAPTKADGPSYVQRPREEVFTVNLTDSALEKGDYRFKVLMQIPKPTGETEIYPAEISFKK